eukprot:CAMPEP_0178425934 /NCGR_PEP_ID=MMETSP0689_2-20121128/28977_1 /TAXON_ID=160604 /ORGANISM="Amphidinium massartii, Strain CS-259" /LENGTH=50 /DNA_ID=CAMNT_0020047609 /DNA_START=400 /DNA_END=552 /DNA_ORIENTATION=-
MPPMAAQTSLWHRQPFSTALAVQDSALALAATSEPLLSGPPPLNFAPAQF